MRQTEEKKLPARPKQTNSGSLNTNDSLTETAIIRLAQQLPPSSWSLVRNGVSSIIPAPV
jgi:hypothetical protein